MRAASRLLASVKASQFLETGAPTGLTGLLTHASPRSTLLYHYHSTLDKLQQIPATSVYRQSTEALTKRRLQIIEQAKPHGWDEWQQQVRDKVGQDTAMYKVVSGSAGQTVVLPKKKKEVDFREPGAQWDGEALQSLPEGLRSSKERASHVRKMKGSVDYTPERALFEVKLDPEPQFTAEAISELESQFGAGLLEEVIAVAEGEHELVDTMIAAKVWEPLDEAIPDGQWSYFER